MNERAGQERPLDVLSFGEALIDFFPDSRGVPLRSVKSFSPCVGGAPANVAYGVARLGGRPAFMSVVGADEFGAMIVDDLRAAGVDTSAVRQTQEAKTGITFVQLDADGERSFLFYRDPSADMTMTAEHVDRELVRRCRVVHAGTNLMMSPPTLEATNVVLKEARDAGAIVSLDANLRPHLWQDRSVIRDTILGSLDPVTLFKTNADELAFLVGDATPAEAFVRDFEPRGIEALVVTGGGEGAQVVARGIDCHVATRPVDVVNTTGAGDGFMAGMLLALARFRASGNIDAVADMSQSQWQAALKLGNLVGSSVCTMFGAITGVPAAEDVPWTQIGVAPSP